MITEQRINLKFLVRLEKSPSVAFCMLQYVYKEQTLPSSAIFLRHKCKEGREDVLDNPKCERTSASRSETNVELVKMVRGECR